MYVITSALIGAWECLYILALLGNYDQASDRPIKLPTHQWTYTRGQREVTLPIDICRIYVKKIHIFSNLKLNSIKVFKTKL